MPEVCKAVGSTLIAEHDRLYGPGTGKAFVEGPYASDLPRALKARIRPALKRQAAQFAMVAEAPEPAAAAADTSTASHAVPAAGAKQPRRRGRLCASGPEADRDHRARGDQKPACSRDRRPTGQVCGQGRDRYQIARREPPRPLYASEPGLLISFRGRFRGSRPTRHRSCPWVEGKGVCAMAVDAFKAMLKQLLLGH